MDIPFGVARADLVAFRNHARTSLELGEGFNVVAGANAQGKTNLLEALHLLATTRLLRGQRDGEAVMDGADRAEVAADLRGTGTRLGIALARGVRKRAYLNGASVPRASDLIGRLPCVCVTTADLEIVRGDPAVRRDFLDLELSALSPGYLRHLTMYKRALEQRNALLREARERWIEDAVFEPWELQIAEHGPALRRARQEHVAALSGPVRAAHARMGGGEDVALTYRVRDDATDFVAAVEGLARARQTDVARGGTSLGPHRDDLDVTVEGREARLYGSQGQQRTAVVALKLGGMRHAREVLGGPPMLLLDDILSDLDAERRRRLTEIVLDEAGQTVLTTPEPEAAGPAILDQARVFEVRGGEVTAR